MSLLREMQLMMAGDVGAAVTPPAFIASTNLHNDASVALPSGTLAGDYLVMAITGYDDGTLVNAVSLPANSDVIVASTRFGSSHLLAAWGHVVTAAEVSAGSVAFGNTHAYGFVAAYRPVGATPINVVGTVTTLGSGSGSNVSLTAPSVTTSADNTALLQFCSVFSGSSTVSGTITAPSGYTQDAVEYDNYNYAMSLARKTQATAGSSGDVIAVWNSANAMTGAAVVLFAINGGSPPAASLTTTPTASVSDTTARISFRVSV